LFETNEPKANPLARCKTGLITLLRRAFLKWRGHVQTAGIAVVACQLAVHEHHATRVAAADAQVIGWDQTVDNGCHLPDFLSGKETPPRRVVMHGAVVIEGLPGRYTRQRGRLGGCRSADRKAGHRGENQLTTCQATGSVVIHAGSLGWVANR